MSNSSSALHWYKYKMVLKMVGHNYLLMLGTLERCDINWQAILVLLHNCIAFTKCLAGICRLNVLRITVAGVFGHKPRCW